MKIKTVLALGAVVVFAVVGVTLSQKTVPAGVDLSLQNEDIFVCQEVQGHLRSTRSVLATEDISYKGGYRFESAAALISKYPELFEMSPRIRAAIQTTVAELRAYPKNLATLEEAREGFEVALTIVGPIMSEACGHVLK